MRDIRFLTGAALAALAAAALAQAPFQIHGLHPDLVFTDAIVQVEELGGHCRIKQSRTEGGDVSAQCAFPRDASPAGESGRPATAAPNPMIGTQPITRIGLEAPVESAQVTRIVFVFEGSLDAVAQYLVQQYGQPDHDGTSSAEESWSHSKRRGWIEGNYTLGLLNSPDLVILTVHRPPPDPDAG